MILTKSRLANGQWDGLISDAPERPDLEVLHLDTPVPELELTATTTPGTWALSFAVPSEAVADGVHTLLIRNRADGTTLGHVTLIAGDVAGDNLHAELDLLRAELDMLKRTVRRLIRDSGGS